MKLLAAVAFAVALMHVSSSKKLRLLTGLNGGLVNRLNPGLPLGGLQPAVLNVGGGFLGQPQFAPMVPGVPLIPVGPAGPLGVPYNPAAGVPQQPPFYGVPFSPNFGGQPQPPVLGQMGPPASGGLQYYTGVPHLNMLRAQQGADPARQQMVDAVGPVESGLKQAGGVQAPPRRLYKRSFIRKTYAGHPAPDNQIPTQITPTPTAAEDSLMPNL